MFSRAASTPRSPASRRSAPGEDGSCFVDVAGDQVQGVVLAAAGRGYVDGLRAGRVGDDAVAEVDGGTLDAVFGRGVGEVCVCLDVLGGQPRLPSALLVLEAHGSVAVDAGDGPGVAVRDTQVFVVAAGHDAVADTDVQAVAAGDLNGWCAGVAGAGARVLGEGVQLCRGVVGGDGDGDCRAGFGLADDVRADRCPCFRVGGVDGDAAAFVQLVEELSGFVTVSHRDRELRVFLVLETVHFGEIDGARGRRNGKVEDTAATDSRQLCAVADERGTSPCLISDRDERMGRILVEHAGLVDDDLGRCRLSPPPVQALAISMSFMAEQASMQAWHA